jgi:hypothetical protein
MAPFHAKAMGIRHHAEETHEQIRNPSTRR